MKVYTYRTSGWKETLAAATGDTHTDEAAAEIRRALSDCFRCKNLVVLTGLGTSLHVNIDSAQAAVRRQALAGKRLAPTMAELWTAVETQAGPLFEKALVASRYDLDTEGRNIESLLSHCKAAERFVTTEDLDAIQRFIALAEERIRQEVRFLAADDDVSVHANFLRCLARRSTRKARPRLFTTNYDLCFEYAARQGRYVVIDGFSHTTPQVFDSLYFSYDVVRRAQESDGHDFVSNVFLLYKLHGSIDWTLNRRTNEIEKDPQTATPLLIYPRSTKYQLAFEQPYIEMMAALQASLRQPDTGLLIVGFGFNDSHIAEPVLSAIRSNLSMKVAICDPSLPDKLGTEPLPAGVVSNAYLTQIKFLVDANDARLALIGATFAEIVPELPDIAADNDLEQHMERVRLLRGQNHAS